MSAPERRAASAVFTALGSLCGAGTAALAWTGRYYYLLPAAQRPLSELHARLRPSGSLGLIYGIIGLTLIILNLSYLVRSSLLHWDWLGSLRSWMSMHVFTGITGALFVLLHSAFLLRNPMAALAAISLFIVVGSGIMGRYIYTHVPRSLQGRELELGELEKAIKELHGELTRKGMEVAEETGEAAAPHKTVLAALTAMISSDREEKLEFEELRLAVLASPQLAASAAGLLPLARRFVREKHWLASYNELRELMRSWRVFHRWFSIMMIIVAVLHVLVATNLGGLGLSLP